MGEQETVVEFGTWIAEHERLLVMLESDSSQSLDAEIEHHILDTVRELRAQVRVAQCCTPPGIA
jgi:DNA-binding GntR family transcriptional regulator